MRKVVYKRIFVKGHEPVRGVTWTCRNCGKVFMTQAQLAVHLLTCS